ncbi:MAG: tRNA epoxyqueuosine(34) reductase QueG [Candidatus Marinimicrobia bacterium]|nr:tRNA epoxyqueuosine(34) reductase QueG [Candidatus Neomarinimicrobiota bacterium]
MLKHKDLVKLGEQLGIDKLGVARAEAIRDHDLTAWLNKGYHGQMGYMENNREKRQDPTVLMTGAQSVISAFINYHQKEAQPDLDGRISRYARSIDYHVTVKDLLHKLAAKLLEPEVTGMSRKERAKVYRVFVDSAPVMEKHWAIQAGIGWQGKHTNIITTDLGSWGFLGEIITTVAFDEYDTPVADHCGTCTACIDACPTNAIIKPYELDGSRCISYATIELDANEKIPSDIREHMEEWFFGCDICQDVCPWNRSAPASQADAFQPVAGFADGECPDFHQMDEERFNKDFGQTPLERPGLAGLRRNQLKRD